MKKYLFLMLVFPFFLSCNNDEKKARMYLTHANELYENADYASAKLKLDSIKLLYPKQLNMQQESLRLMRLIEWKEQERNLAYCDSVLIVRQQESEALKPEFIFEKTEYDEVGKYFDKKQKVENNLQKSYLRVWTDEFGGIVLASVYYGAKPLNHSGLKVSDPATGEFAETQLIPDDGGLNYSFKDLGMTTEIVSYSKEKDNGVILFICDRKDKPLKAEFLGGGKYSITISSSDKNALTKTVEFSSILSDIEHLKKEKEKAAKRIEYLRKKLS